MERKGYECKKCGRVVAIRSKGLCPSCRSKELQKETGVKKKELHKKVYRKKTNPELSGFFRLMVEKLQEIGVSMTGLPIHSPTVCNVCHILPKRWYKSVATEEDNILFLTESEHTRFDSLLDRMDFGGLEKEFNSIWRFAVRMVLKMENKGLIKERGRLIIEIIDRYDGLI